MDKRVVIFLESMALGGLQRVAIDHAEFLIAKGYSVQMVALNLEAHLLLPLTAALNIWI